MYKKAAIKAKLQIVKNALIEVLAEARMGISLAQLPLYLKRKLPFMLNLNELGFAKLKDLVLSMSDQIKLELRSHNHPFAYLIHSGKPLHSKGNSDDLGPPAQFRQTLRNPPTHLSEDLNQLKYLKDAIMRGEAPQIEPLLTAFYSLLREFPMGIDARRIPFLLSSRLGY